MKAANRYSLNDLVAQVTAAKPDLICGEIEAEHYEGPLEGIFPPEAALLAEIAPGIGATFAPVDWRGDYLGAREAERRVNAATAARLHAMASKIWEGMATISESSSLMDYLYRSDVQKATREIHDGWVNAGGEAADGYSTTRNRNIVRNCLDAARRHNSRRVVFAFGVDHMYAIQDEAQAQAGLIATLPPRQFSPTNAPVSPNVVARWRKNQASLTSVRNSASTSPGTVAMIDGLKRIEELDVFLRSNGQAH